MDNTSSHFALLAGAIDYAGLFPPTELDLAAALANYRAYQRSADRWALSRFVIPADRLAELEDVLRTATGTAHRLPLAVVLGPRTAIEMAAVEHFNQGTPEHQARAETVELKAPTVAAARALLTEVPATWPRYIEPPIGELSEGFLDTIVEAGAFAKLRTGGITAAAIPAPDDVIRFLQGAAERKLAFKATAGLHHAVRGAYPLTYAADAPRGEMYGYLNLLLASAVLWQGGTTNEARDALLEQEARAIRFTGTTLTWGSRRFTTPALVELRASFVHSFGSCSFREPLDELAAGPWH